MDYLAQAREAVEKSHNCEAIFVNTVPVKEMLGKEVAWEGQVEVFYITGHPHASRCFAWGYSNEKRGGKLDFVTVLEIPPVTSPQTAVKAAIAATAKKSL